LSEVILGCYNARTKAEFDTAIDAILKESRLIIAYLRLILVETWATYAFLML
jgi:hypothetical protein